MCGIVGIRVFRNSDRWKQKIKNLVFSTEARGRDGFGMVLKTPTSLAVLKKRERMSKVASEVSDFLENIQARSMLLVSSRAQPLPEESSVDIDNIPPFVSRNKEWWVVHNGTISNDRELAKELEITVRVDTQVIAEMLTNTSVRKICEKLVGGFAVIAMAPSYGHFLVFKNYKTLWYVWNEDLFAVASEREQLLPFAKGGIYGVEMFPRDTIFSVKENGRIIAQPFNKTVWGSLPELDENKAVVVTSGGLDSSTAAFVAKKIHGVKDVLLLNFDYGHRAADREWEAVQAVAEKLGAEARHIDLKWLGQLGRSPLTDRGIELPLGMRSVESTLCFVPARNLVMVVYAAAVAEAEGRKWIYYGNNLEEEGVYPDNDREFLYAVNEALAYGTLRGGIRIRNCLARLMKVEIVALGTYLGVPFDRTWSCDTEGVKVGDKTLPCGICGCCTTRWHAFRRAGIPDPEQYAQEPIDKYVWLERGETTKVDIDEIISRLE